MRIFVDPTALVAGELVVRGDEHHYLSRVRRARAGDPIELVDGAGRRARASIVRIADADTVLAVGAVETVVELPPRIRVLVPLIKGDRMDTCLEKLVEVGADELVVWPAARSVVKLDADRRESRRDHYAGAIEAAARQCGRASLPSVVIVESLAKALAALPAGVRLVLDPSADRREVPTATDVTVIGGPEGGLAPAELDSIRDAGFLSIGLGPRTLRAETAPVIAVALLRAATAS